MSRYLIPAALLAVTVPAAQTCELPSGIQTALEQWRQQHGSQAWQVILDEETELAALLLNGSAPISAPPPETDEDWFSLARSHVDSAHGLFGIDVASLVNDRVILLPLGIVGTTDKVSVSFQQFINGVQVSDSWMTTLFDTQGSLLSIESHALSALAGISMTPSITAAEAEATARSAFTLETGLPPFSVSIPFLAVCQTLVESQREGLLAWQVHVGSDDSAGVREAYKYYISATQPAFIIHREDLVHEAFQQGGGAVSGVVRGQVTIGAPSWPADDNQQNTQLVAMPSLYLRNMSGNILTTTFQGGQFVLPGQFAGRTVILEYEGPYAEVDSFGATAGHLEATMVLGNGNIITFGADDQRIVAEANCFYRINQMRDWLSSFNPTDDTFDNGAPYTARPNVPFGCDAAFDSDSLYVRFSKQQAGTCEDNLAHATIIWHEMGHWMNFRYGHGNDGGFGEGAADVWSMYISDYGQVGAGPDARLGSNMAQFCGDCPIEPDCATDPHQAGLPLMGALWKVRQNLKASLGDELGGATANSLFVAWMNSTKIGSLKSWILYQWLALDSAVEYLRMPRA